VDMGSSNEKEGTAFTNTPKSYFLGVAVVGLVGLGFWVWKNRVDLATHSFLDPLLPEETPVGIEKVTTLMIKNSNGLTYTHSIKATIEFRNIETKKVEDAALWEIEDNRSGTVSVSIVPKTVGKYEYSLLIGNKRIQGAPWNIVFVKDDRLYDNFPININSPLGGNELVMFGKHSDIKPVKPSEIEYPPLIEAIKTTDNYWPRNVKFLYNICMDYGRSHYFFTDAHETIPAQIHTFGFGNYGTATLEERTNFFTNLGISGNVIPIFLDPSPTRSNLLTRTKYELLQRYILSTGKSAYDASRLAIAILASTTQHTLRFLTILILDAIPNTFRHQVSFCYFQINITHQNDAIYLKFSLINYVPTTGTWQSSPTKPLSRNNRKKNSC